MGRYKNFELILYFECGFVKNHNEFLDDVGTNSPEVLKSEFQQVVSSQDKSPEKEQFHVDQGAAEDVVCQLGPLHGSPLALSLTISPLHFLPLPQVKGLAREST